MVQTLVGELLKIKAVVSDAHDLQKHGVTMHPG